MFTSVIVYYFNRTLQKYDKNNYPPSFSPIILQL